VIETAGLAPAVFFFALAYLPWSEHGIK
jgi:hypothetical protein